MLTAGTDLAPGDPVCLKREHLLPDKALLQHGLLSIDQQSPDAANAAVLGSTAHIAQPQPQPEPDVALFGMDRPDFGRHAQDQLPWQVTFQEAPAVFTGEVVIFLAMVATLQAVLVELWLKSISKSSAGDCFDFFDCIEEPLLGGRA